jgi:hypothetical protein
MTTWLRAGASIRRCGFPDIEPFSTDLICVAVFFCYRTQVHNSKNRSCFVELLMTPNDRKPSASQPSMNSQELTSIRSREHAL